MLRGNPFILSGYEGLSMIAASGLDMVAWDALQRLRSFRFACCSEALPAR